MRAMGGGTLAPARAPLRPALTCAGSVTAAFQDLTGSPGPSHPGHGFPTSSPTGPSFLIKFER